MLKFQIGLALRRIYLRTENISERLIPDCAVVKNS